MAEKRAENVRPSMSLEAVPGVSRLYRDYVAGREPAASLFPMAPFDHDAAELARRIDKRDYERGALASVLLEQNESYGAGERTLAHCRALEDPAALAVVTGQQVGFLGGPLYAAVKALHAARLAARLEEKLERPVVPIFWMELEDHDLAEVDHVFVRDRDNNVEPVRIEFDKPGDGTPVNRIPVGAGIATAIETLKQTWGSTEFSAELFALIERCYTTEATLADGFARFMTSLLSPFGVILADPSSPFFKRRVSDLFVREIDEPLTATETFARQSERIDAARYHRQVRADSGRLSFYLLDGEEKLRINTRGDGFFSLDDPGDVISAEDLRMVAQSEPERLIPNVLLRPLVQDSLFPTLAYVAGPGEIAYLAQLPPAYEHFDVPMPVIVPRAGVTLIGGAARRTIERYGIEVREIFQPLDKLLGHILGEHVPSQADHAFRWTRETISGALERLRSEIDSGEGNAGKLVETTQEKIGYHLQKLRERYMKELESRHEVVVRRIETLAAALFPGEKPQERVYCVAEFLNQYGPAVLERIHDDIDPENPVHAFVEI